MNNIALPTLDVVVFEVPSAEDADELTLRLDRECIAWTEPSDDDAWIVGAELRETDDLARLLRTVERWVAQRRLVAIRYSLDAKSYILRAGDVAWSAFSTDLAPLLAAH